MEVDLPQLSICIPTFNRAEMLSKTLDSIVLQKRFLESNDIEIIISDNFSTDNTSHLVHEYIKKYPGKIIYNLNNENINDKNFATSLSLASGNYLKLNNDTLMHLDGSLDYMIDHIVENKTKKITLLFTNGAAKKNTTEYHNFDLFIQNISGYCTFAGCFGIWKTQFTSVEDFNRRSDWKLPHTDFLFRTFKANNVVCIKNKIIFNSLHPHKKGGYDLLRVFMENYIYLLREQLESGLLTENTYSTERKKVLIDFVRPWLLNIIFYPKLYTFTCENAFKRIFISYKNDYLLLSNFVIQFSLLSLRYFILKLLKLILPINIYSIIKISYLNLKDKFISALKIVAKSN